MHNVRKKDWELKTVASTCREHCRRRWWSQDWCRTCSHVQTHQSDVCVQRWGCRHRVVAGPLSDSQCHPMAPLDDRDTDRYGSCRLTPLSALGSSDSVCMHNTFTQWLIYKQITLNKNDFFYYKQKTVLYIAWKDFSNGIVLIFFKPL